MGLLDRLDNSGNLTITVQTALPQIEPVAVVDIPQAPPLRTGALDQARAKWYLNQIWLGLPREGRDTFEERRQLFPSDIYPHEIIQKLVSRGYAEPVSDDLLVLAGYHTSLFEQLEKVANDLIMEAFTGCRIAFSSIHDLLKLVRTLVSSDIKLSEKDIPRLMKEYLAKVPGILSIPGGERSKLVCEIEAFDDGELGLKRRLNGRSSDPTLTQEVVAVEHGTVLTDKGVKLLIEECNELIDVTDLQILQRSRLREIALWLYERNSNLNGSDLEAIIIAYLNKRFMKIPGKLEVAWKVLAAMNFDPNICRLYLEFPSLENLNVELLSNRLAIPSLYNRLIEINPELSPGDIRTLITTIISLHVPDTQERVRAFLVARVNEHVLLQQSERETIEAPMVATVDEALLKQAEHIALYKLIERFDDLKRATYEWLSHPQTIPVLVNTLKELDFTLDIGQIIELIKHLFRQRVDDPDKQAQLLAQVDQRLVFVEA